MEGRNIAGPTLRRTTVAGGCKNTYVMKKTSVIVEYRKPTIVCKSIDCVSKLSSFRGHIEGERTNTHAAYTSDTKIGPVHQADAIQKTTREDQTDVDASNDLLLLLWREGIDTALVAEMAIGIFRRDRPLQLLRRVGFFYVRHFE